jgi:hypothetical protein
LPVFAVIVCRKFAIAAAFSWHLPHHKNAAGWRDSELGRQDPNRPSAEFENAGKSSGVDASGQAVTDS